jgi:hypothetical protein
MSVWCLMPSARPVGEVNVCTDKWRETGYKLGLWRDAEVPEPDLKHDFSIGGFPWRGYPHAINRLAERVFGLDSECDWAIAAADDTFPDPNKSASEIAYECTDYLFRLHEKQCPGCKVEAHKIGTFGVMQPTGDPWSDHMGRIIERIAGSPWLGREWCRRAYQGKGPLNEEYRHCFPDEELQCVAQKLGVFWQRPDLVHYHQNWARARGDRRDMPEFLREANSPEHWKKYQALFNRRKAAGFPGSEPLA